MASTVLSGVSNPSYTNTTGQNVRIVINYMANCTSMSWAGVNVTGSSTVVSKDSWEIIGEFKAAGGIAFNQTGKPSPIDLTATNSQGNLLINPNALIYIKPPFGTGTGDSANIFYVPTQIRPGGTFPTQIILANSQAFSAICGSYNIVIIKEDGT